MANINENIISKVESMIETKKKPEKVYSNNPPKKEVLRKEDQEAVNRSSEWNNHFNARYNNRELK